MDRKSIMSAAIIIGLIVIVSGYEIWSMLFSNYPIVNFPPRGQTIVAFGDSLTEGVGASSPDKGYVPLLEERLGITIVNKGVSGNTSAQALARVDEVTALHPDIVIVLLGGNDILQRTQREATFTNLSAIIHRVQQEGAVVLLVGIDGLIGNAYRNDFDKLAKETGSLYVPDIMDGIVGTPALLSDEIHPNDAGYIKFVDRIAPVLEGAVLSAPKLQTQGTATVRTSPASE